MTGVFEDMEEFGQPYTAGGNVKLCSYCGKPSNVSSKVEHSYHIVETPLLGICSRALKACLHKTVHCIIWSSHKVNTTQMFICQ